jgi:hypothetical protein
VIPPAVFRRVADPLLRLRGGRLREGLDRSRVFFPYFSMSVRYSNDGARRALEPAGVATAPIESYFDRLLDYALLARWGRTPLTRAQAARRAGLAPKVPRLRREPAARVLDEDRALVLVG